MVVSFVLLCFFFKQKTAYEMRISDWSSDVCSSDLVEVQLRQLAVEVQGRGEQRCVGARLRHRGYGWRGHGSATGTRGAAACSRASTRSGPKWQLKVLPWPTSLSISSRAWCSCRMCLTIDRPRPVPPDSRERLVDTR